MTNRKLKDFLLGSVLLGGLVVGGGHMMHKSAKDKTAKKNKADIELESDTVAKTAAKTVVLNPVDNNVALFDAARSKIKFALAFVENFSPTAYNDGTGKWTVGYGLTILYNADGTSRPVRQNDKLTMAQADVYKGRYLTHDILPDIKKCVKVAMDENTLIATCVFRYCIGGKNFRKSQYLQKLNEGVRGAELAKYLTGFRAQAGLMNRSYFFAALLGGQITFDDLLNLRAEGCYSLKPADMAKYNAKTKRYIVDENNFAIWDFSKIEQNLEIAQKPRRSPKLGECQLVCDIVPDYILQDTGTGARRTYTAKKSTQKSDDAITVTQAARQMHDKAIAKYRKKDYAGAVAILADLTKTNYNSAALQNDISAIEYAAHNYAQALGAAQAAAALATTDKEKSASFYNMGMAHAAMGDYTDALRCYDLAAAAYNNKAVRNARNIAVNQMNQTLAYHNRGF